jgi:hypothetical protein
MNIIYHDYKGLPNIVTDIVEYLRNTPQHNLANSAVVINIIPTQSLFPLPPRIKVSSNKCTDLAWVNLVCYACYGVLLVSQAKPTNTSQDSRRIVDLHMQQARPRLQKNKSETILKRVCTVDKVLSNDSDTLTWACITMTLPGRSTVLGAKPPTALHLLDNLTYKSHKDARYYTNSLTLLTHANSGWPSSQLHCARLYLNLPGITSNATQRSHRHRQSWTRPRDGQSLCYSRAKGARHILHRLGYLPYSRNSTYHALGPVVS